MRLLWSDSYQRWNIFGNNLSALDSVKATGNSAAEKETALQQLFKYLQGIKPEIRFEPKSSNEWAEITEKPEDPKLGELSGDEFEGDA